MKKSILKLAMMFIAILASVTFLSSCGPDEPEPTSGPTPPNSLVGTWGIPEDDDYIYMMFCANGVAYEFSKCDTHGADVDKYEYVYNEKDNKVIFIEGHEVATIEIISLTEDKLIFKNVEGEFTVAKKVTSPFTEAQLERYYKGDTPSSNSIVGTWKYSWDVGYVQMKFNSDGTGVYVEYDYDNDEGQYEYFTASFRYTYDRTKGKIDINYHNNEEGDWHNEWKIEWLDDKKFYSDWDGGSVWVKQ
ncbi:MAG: hypothetical protein MJZ69_11320 [Bacteroidaceae bacterium]|nr:hypothetical protein [Bacteroidaceae bacterium]